MSVGHVAASSPRIVSHQGHPDTMSFGALWMDHHKLMSALDAVPACRSACANLITGSHEASMIQARSSTVPVTVLLRDILSRKPAPELDMYMSSRCTVHYASSD